MGKERRMIVSDGYSIEQHQGINQIVITMPQTEQTITSTATIISNRRMLTGDELCAVLALVKAFAERKEQ